MYLFLFHLTDSYCLKVVSLITTNKLKAEKYLKTVFK